MKSIVTGMLSAVLFASIVSTMVVSLNAASYSIELEEFRWTSFPLNVLVDMNQWSVPNYAADVREALDAWLKAIWNYTQTYNDTTLAAVNYLLYFSSVNYTNTYDVLITFTPSEISPPSNTIGWTAIQWNPITHEPIPPTIINITTYSATASDLFIRNVVMHEFGHALGLNHASSQTTTNGPEIMYYLSPRNQAAYPSTLDVYGLAVEYKGNFSPAVQLPLDIPYIMLTSGNVPPPPVPSITTFWEQYKQYILLGLLMLVLILALSLARTQGRTQPEETQPQTPPPPQQKSD